MATPFPRKKLLLLGSGELGKEVAIEAIRLGMEVVACDRYPGAPAMQVAHRSHIFPMMDGVELRGVVEMEKPDFIVPEIEAIDTETLVHLEEEGWHVIPTARAVRLTMDREGIRRLAAEDLKLSTSPYAFAGNFEELEAAVKEIGLPCVIKPTMSSSGHGQSVVRKRDDLQKAWEYAQTGTRVNTGRVIVEGFIKFDYEITLLTVRHLPAQAGAAGTSFCAPIGHIQIDGDYRESWQPHPMRPKAIRKTREIAREIVENLCMKKGLPAGKQGRGIFGVEFFVKGDDVWFSELSPRPHDTGMVTMASQTMSEMELHVRAILGLPIPLAGRAEIPCRPGASAAILAHGNIKYPVFSGVSEALQAPGNWVRLFEKPEVVGHRRMGVALAIGKNIKEARKKALAAARRVKVSGK